MNTHLRPTYQRWFSDYCVLWYKTSNSYTVVDRNFKTLLDTYLSSETISELTEKLALTDRTLDIEALLVTIDTYLENCNEVVSSPTATSVAMNTSHRRILKHYTVNGKAFQIYYDSESVMKTIHPALAHLCVATDTAPNITFDIYIKDKKIHLFENGLLIKRVPQHDYHLIQGKFIMHLLCHLHDKKEDDWIGTFHGSTITDGNSSILCIGNSGKGKSTLCALLAANGFNLLADDVSPMLSRTKEIYFNPSAISIKEGAFKTLEPLVENFKDLPIIGFNPSKGPMKYVPCQPPKENSYDCGAIILINYKDKAETLLENISIKTVLETLIPESWISPNPKHAKAFLDWLETVQLYQLTYSDTASVRQELSQLFSALHKN